jgi:hypothetical protein
LQFASTEGGLGVGNHASIDPNGHVSFADNITDLDAQIMAVEQAISAANDPNHAHAAIWENNGDTYVLMQGPNGANSQGNTPNEAVVKIVGVDSSQVALENGVIVHH